MFNFLKNLFKSKPSYFEFLIEREIADRKFAQTVEDQRVERSIKYEARRLFEQWYNAPTITIAGKEYKNCLQLIQPIGMCYYIHDETAAKYHNQNISEIIKKEYIKYKEDFIKENGE